MTWRGKLVVCLRCNHMDIDTVEESDDEGATLLCECRVCGHQWDMVAELAPPSDEP